MKRTGNRGIAIIVALLALLILSTLGATIMFVTQTEVATTTSYKRLTQARYAAEAGAQSAMNWIIFSYTPPSSMTGYTLTTTPVQASGQPVVLSAMSGVTGNYPVSSVQTAFSDALLNKTVPGLDINVTYSVTATLQTMQAVTPFGGGSASALQSWLIRSRGTIAGSQAQVEVTTTIERFGSPVFSYAAFGLSATCGAITLSGGATTDSFDSGSGTYAATHLNSSGDIGTNGNINMSGGAAVHGAGSTPYSTSGNCASGALTSTSISGGATISSTVTLPSTLSFATPASPNPAPPTTTQNLSGTCGTISGCTQISSQNVSLAPGPYGNLSVSGGTTVHLTAGTYRINKLALSGGASLILDSAPVTLNFAGSGVTGGTKVIDLSGGSVTNSSGHPSDLQIMYGGAQGVTLSGGAGSYGVVYTPNAPVTMSGGSGWYGSVVANTVNISGGGSIHYDRSLATNLSILGNYHTTSFGWSKY